MRPKYVADIPIGEASPAAEAIAGRKTRGQHLLVGWYAGRNYPTRSDLGILEGPSNPDAPNIFLDDGLTELPVARELHVKKRPLSYFGRYILQEIVLIGPDGREIIDKKPIEETING